MSETVPTWTERWWQCLGSEAHCQVLGGPDHLIDNVIDDVERLEQCWSRFRSTSELTRLNGDPSSEVEVSAPLAEAIHRALIAWERTDGWFDPTVIESLESAGYTASFLTDGKRRGSLASCRASPGLEHVTVDLDRRIVRRPPGLRFDLGGIGKGLAADLIAASLVDRGATSVCVGLGGDIRVAGETPDEGWHIRVEPPGIDPVNDDEWFTADLSHGAIVTSTTRFRSWTTTEGEPAHHLIDPRDGRPSRSGVETVVVAADEAWWAEVLSKAALLAGPREGRRLLERHDVTSWMVATTPSVTMAAVP